MAKRKLRTNSIVSNLLIKLGIILVILGLASYLKLRMDFSSNKAYSLSPISKEAVKGLKDNLVLKIYASEELPAEMSTLDRYLKDLLSEYQLAGKGKFHYEFVRGLSPEQLRTQAIQNGLSGMYFKIYENDKTTTKEIIYGLVFEYQGLLSTLNLRPQMEPQLEYQLTLKMQKLTRHNLPNVVVYADTLFTYLPSDKFSTGMSENYNVSFTDLKTPPPAAKVMIFTGARDSLSTVQLYNLDQFIMHGGSLVVLQDHFISSDQGIQGINSNIYGFLEHYGLKVSTEMVMDVFCDIRGVGVSNSISFPVYPVVRGSDHPITRNISNIVLYLASGLAPSGQQGVNFNGILYTSSKSAVLEGPGYVLDPDLFQSPDPEVFKHPPITVGATLDGKFTSYFAGKQEQATPGFIGETTQSRIVAFGDRDLFIDPDKAIYDNRYYIVLNAVDWLLNRNSMISIRARNMQSSILDIPYYMSKHNIVWGDLEKIERQIRMGVKVASAVLPSLLLIIAGLLMALHRKQLAGEEDE